MDTKFTKLETNYLSDWDVYFMAGDAWLQSLQVLEDNKQEIGGGVFYVLPWIVAFCLELYIKALAAYEDHSFNGQNYYHKISKIITEYKIRIPIFKTISDDAFIMNLISEYEKTKDTKYAQTYVCINGVDQSKLIKIIYELRSEICKRTGLR